MQYEVLVPTFVNIHLFWIVPKKYLITRFAMEKIMKSSELRPLTGQLHEDMMVALNIEGKWARGIIEAINNEITCWLPDFGIKKTVTSVYPLPPMLKRCPYIAKQASLENVVNILTELNYGANGYEVSLRKTTNNIVGIARAALTRLESSESICFEESREDDESVYGDLLITTDGVQQSLTEFLIDSNLISKDEELFLEIAQIRNDNKKAYFAHNNNLDLAQVEKIALKTLGLDDVKDLGPSTSHMEFFDR